MITKTCEPLFVGWSPIWSSWCSYFATSSFTPPFPPSFFIQRRWLSVKILCSTSFSYRAGDACYFHRLPFFHDTWVGYLTCSLSLLSLKFGGAGIHSCPGSNFPWKKHLTDYILLTANPLFASFEPIPFCSCPISVDWMCLVCSYFEADLWPS